jgi:hypothetical protein
LSIVPTGQEHASAPHHSPDYVVGQYLHTHTYTHPPYALALKMEAACTSETLATLSIFTQCKDSRAESTSSKIILLYILIFRFLYKRQEYKML